jgi:hypothetical protein
MQVQSLYTFCRRRAVKPAVILIFLFIDVLLFFWAPGCMFIPDSKSQAERADTTCISDYSGLELSDREFRLIVTLCKLKEEENSLKSLGVQPVQTNLVSEELENYNKTIKEIIDTENRLTNDRMMWMLTINGFLFAILGFAWDRLKKIILGLGIFSMIAIFSLYIAIASSVEAINDQEQHRENIITAMARTQQLKDEILPPVIGLGPGELKPFFDRALPWKLLPPLLIVIWQLTIIFTCMFPGNAKEPTPSHESRRWHRRRWSTRNTCRRPSGRLRII